MEKIINDVKSVRELLTETTNIHILATAISNKYTYAFPVIDIANATTIITYKYATKYSDDTVINIKCCYVRNCLPFEGDSVFFNINPRNPDLLPIYGNIDEDNNILTLEYDVENGAKYEIEYINSQNIYNLFKYIGYVKEVIIPFYKDLQHNVESMIYNLNSTFKHDTRYVVARLPKNISTDRDISNDIFEAEQCTKSHNTVDILNSETMNRNSKAFDYEDILCVIGGMSHVMERNPSKFKDIDEETLRVHFLVQLNGHFQGEATGETFNYKGKTDILIRSGDRNVFIAECKFWKGPKGYLKTIDQLLSYLTWRDSKAAVIIFNRNKDFAQVLKAIEKKTASHPNYKRFIRKRSETSFQFIFRHKDDPEREMTVTVMAFDVPK